MKLIQCMLALVGVAQAAGYDGDSCGYTKDINDLNRP